jgi:signal transduction histidine kinase
VTATAATQELAALFGDAAVELRFSLTGRCAVRVLAPRGPVAARHAESPAPPAPWSAQARCGSAVGWLLAARPPADERSAVALLDRIVERRTALVLQRLAAQDVAIAAELLERLTHSLRTDLGALQAVAEGLTRGVFARAELVEICGGLESAGREARRRLSAVRDVMAVLAPDATSAPEALQESLRAELEGAGARAGVEVHGVDGERAMTLIPGDGWGACARLVAEAIAADARLGGERAAVAIGPHPGGWAITAGRRDPVARAVAWTEQAVGPLAVAGQIAAAAAGSATAFAGAGGGLQVTLVVPAAPSPPHGGDGA